VPKIIATRYETDRVDYALDISDAELEALMAGKDSQDLLDGLFARQDACLAGQSPSSSDPWYGFENLEDHTYYEVEED